MKNDYTASIVDIANKLRLPLMKCPVTWELYGYAYPILDEERARTLLRMARVRDEASVAEAMAVLHDRVAKLSS